MPVQTNPNSSSPFSVTLKGAYFPTFYRHYYNLTELQSLNTALLEAKSLGGHDEWLNSVFRYSLLSRQLLPISGLYYVEILAGSVYGFTLGLLLTWIIEVQCAIFLYLLFAYLMPNSPQNRFFTLHDKYAKLLKLLSNLDGSAQAQIKLNQAPFIARGTRILGILILTALRYLSVVPNWLLNSTLIELGVPFIDYAVSAGLGALPHLTHSLTIGVGLSWRTEEVDHWFTSLTYYLLVCLWWIVKGLFCIKMYVRR